MRIIAGSHRGKRILAPPGRTTRPITDRVKESLFAILGEQVRDALVADLFAGSGSLGLEALSRQAKFCFFVETDQPALRLLKQNVTNLGLQGEAKIINKNAWRFPKWFRTQQPLDLIFVDPPYLDSRCSAPDSRLGKLLTQLAESGLLRDRGTVILRHESIYPCQDKYGQLTLMDSRRYGSMTLSILKRAMNTERGTLADAD
jgi:16S rRNA (guanine966-N2)-methyltransferase